MSVPVDVRAVMKALEDLAHHRLLRKRRDFDRAVASGRQPHHDLVVITERAEYLRNQAQKARSAMAELVEAVKAERKIVRSETRPTREQLQSAIDRTDAALARVQGAAS